MTSAAPTRSRLRTWRTCLNERGRPPCADGGRDFSACLGCGERLRPLLRLFDRVELADEYVDAPRQLGKKSDFVPSAAVAFGNDDRIDQDWYDDALRVVELHQRAQLVHRLATRSEGIRKRLSSS